MRYFLLALFFYLSSIPASTAASSVHGNVAIDKKDNAPAFPDRYSAHGSGHTREAGIDSAVVYLIPLNQSGATGQPTNEKLIQRDLEFVPQILPIQTGTTVEFINEDEEYHNILSYSKTKRFDLGRYRKDDPAPVVTFDQSGVVKIYCEIHEHMRGIILVLDTPYFTEPDSKGHFQIDGLPAGNYEAVLWTKKGTVHKKIILDGVSALTLDFT